MSDEMTIRISGLFRLQRQCLEWKHRYEEAAAEIRLLNQELEIAKIRMERAEAQVQVFIEEFKTKGGAS